jgi:hypothetical protein
MVSVSKKYAIRVFFITTIFGLGLVFLSLNEHSNLNSSTNLQQENSQSLVHKSHKAMSNNPNRFIKDDLLIEVDTDDEVANNIKKTPTKTNSKLISNLDEYVNKFIEKPFDYRRGSGLLPILVGSLLTEGDILQLGMRALPTNLLHKISLDFKRKVVSIDTDQNLVQKYLDLNQTQFHRVYHMTIDEMHAHGRQKLWGMVLVDHSFAQERSLDVQNLANRAKVVLATDSEKRSENIFKYDQRKITDNFKYSCKFSLFQNKEKSSYASTWLLSNYDSMQDFNYILSKISTDFGLKSCDSTL